jgi:hypothetical protein
MPEFKIPDSSKSLSGVKIVTIAQVYRSSAPKRVRMIKALNLKLVQSFWSVGLSPQEFQLVLHP